MPRSSQRLRTPTTRLQQANKMMNVPKKRQVLKIKKQQRKEREEGKGKRRKVEKKGVESKQEIEISLKEMTLEPLIEHPSNEILEQQKLLWNQIEEIQLKEFDQNSVTVVKSLFDELLESNSLPFI